MHLDESEHVVSFEANDCDGRATTLSAAAAAAVAASA